MSRAHEHYRHIVVALDGGDESWSALEEAIRIARASQARLDLLVAIPDNASAGGRTSQLHVLQRAATRAADLPVMSYAIEGDPGSVIIEHAETRQCDLIVMGCRSGIEPDDKLGESVSIAVSQQARVPVVIVRT